MTADRNKTYRAVASRPGRAEVHAHLVGRAPADSAVGGVGNGGGAMMPGGREKRPVNNNPVSSIELWGSLPRELAALYRPHTKRIIQEVLDEIRRSVPEYDVPANSIVNRILTDTVQKLVVQCVESVGNPKPADSRLTELIRQRGREEFREGRTLDSLQAAFRVGGRAAWRIVSEIGLSVGIPAEMLSVGAEAIFAFVNDISRLSLEGFTAEQARAAGTLERRRRRLMELILQQPSVSPKAIVDLAEAAQWQIPAMVTAVALEYIGDPHRVPVSEFDDEVLVDLESAQPCLVTADPDKHLRNAATELHGWRVVVGPEVRFAEAPTSLRWARDTLGLVRRGIIQDSRVIWCREHLATLWLLTDELLANELAKRSLAPLETLTVSQRARLGETLLAWLETRGSAPDIAKALDVHPQTVRYRMHQLEGLFGDRLNNPDDRLEMELALRAQRLIGKPPTTDGHAPKATGRKAAQKAAPES
jgi:hypothetical protein